MGKWDKQFNRPPVRRNRNLERMGTKSEVVERIITTYIETGRSVRSLAKMYGCSKSTIGRYVCEYARELCPYDLYSKARQVAVRNLCKRPENYEEMMYYDSLLGSLD